MASAFAKQRRTKFEDLPLDTSLEDYAQVIRCRFRDVDVSVRTVENRLITTEYQRIDVGRLLLAAQALVLVQLGPGKWEPWCKKNIGRSQRDIRKVMKLAWSDDPTLAHQAEIKANQVARAVAKEQQRASMPALPTAQQTAGDHKVVPFRPIQPPVHVPENEAAIVKAAMAMLATLDSFDLTFEERLEAARQVLNYVQKEQADVGT